MNKEQLEYQAGRLLNGYPDVFYSPLSILLAHITLQEVSQIKNLYEYSHMFVAGVYGSLAILSGKIAFEKIVDRAKIHKDSGKLDDVELYPFAHVKRVSFDDNEILYALLDKTSEKEHNEWGRMLNVHAIDEDAIFDELMAPEIAKESGFILNESGSYITVDDEKAAEEGWYGISHYHPIDGAMNFAINLRDRCATKGFMSLLTFNRSDGPEIIAYNRQHTYIPKDKEEKAELVLAGPKQIMDYLAS